MSLSYNRRKEEEAMVDSRIFFGQMKSARKNEVREKSKKMSFDRKSDKLAAKWAGDKRWGMKKESRLAVEGQIRLNER